MPAIRADQKTHPAVSDGRPVEFVVIFTMKLCTGTRGDDCKTRMTHWDNF
jgi:hypothetical protein